MASVVDTSVKWLSSAMVNAPALPGVAGALVNLLDAALKDGFDLKTLSSLTVAGGVATAAYTGNHSALPDTVVLIAGVTGGPSGWAGLNGEQKVTAKSANAVTFATNLPDGTYTGSITMKMAPLGWLKPFSFTNGGVYKSADPASSGMFLRVDDAAATFARVVGYEAMSDASAGVGPFPSVAQMNGGGYWPKSNAANATPVPWFIVGDSRVFFLFTAPYASTNAAHVSGWLRGFGDMLALRPGGDAFGCGLNYSSNSVVTSMSDGAIGGINTTLSQKTAFPRSYTGVGGSALHSVLSYTRFDVTQMSGTDTVLGTFPSPVDGSLRLSRMYLTAEPSSVGLPRAEVPGLYYVPQGGLYDTFRHLDRTPGSGNLAGRNILAIQIGGASLTGTPAASNTGVLFADVTGPWR